MALVKKPKKVLKNKKKVGKKTAFETPFKKAGYLEKIEGTMTLQRMCKKFGVRFEPAKYFKEGNVSIRDITGTKRVIARSNLDRQEFVTKNLSKEKLKEITGRINSFAGGYGIMLQKVGLRESIQSFGQVKIHGLGHDTNIRIYKEEKYNYLQGKDKIFMVGGAEKKFCKIIKGRFRQDSAKAVNKMFGNQNMSQMLEYLAKSIGRGSVRLRYVKYGRRKPCFYDMIGTYDRTMF